MPDSQRWRRIAVVLLVFCAAITAAVFFATRGSRARHPASTMPPQARAVFTKYVRGAETQPQELASYSDTEVIDAALPGVKKKGEYVLRGRYIAPRQLKFQPVRYSGDGFVKTTVILGYLGRRVAHIKNGEAEASAITPQNFTFTYVGDEFLKGVRMAVFDVRAKRVGSGLFNGRIYLNASTGDLVRAEGKFVESPSMFVKNVTFVKDYGQFDGFTLPTHVHSESDTRIAGRAFLDVFHRDYQVQAARQNALR